MNHWNSAPVPDVEIPSNDSFIVFAFSADFSALMNDNTTKPTTTETETAASCIRFGSSSATVAAVFCKCLIFCISAITIKTATLVAPSAATVVPTGFLLSLFQLQQMAGLLSGTSLHPARVTSIGSSTNPTVPILRKIFFKPL